MAQLGDSLGYLFSRPTDLRELWGAGGSCPDGCRACGPSPGPLHHAALLPGGRRPLPEASFAQVNFADDAVQRRFHEAAEATRTSSRRPWRTAWTRSAPPPPTSAPACWMGQTHCALPRAEFYTLTSGAVRLRDWVAALAEGRPVPNLPPKLTAARSPAAPLRTGR